MYKWLKDGVPVDDFTTSQYYRIHNIRPEDAGSYKCIAQNDAGTIFSEKIDVVVARKFTLPYDLMDQQKKKGEGISRD